MAASLSLGAGVPAAAQGNEPAAKSAGPAHCSKGSRSECRRRAIRNLPFGKGSIWNDRLGRRTKLSPRSDVYVNRLSSSIDEYGAWVNTTEWSSPVYTVGKKHPTVPVTLDKPPGVNPDLRQALAAVPIPPDARPAPDSDAHMVVWQPSTDTMWEFWGARRAADGWHTRYGGKISETSQHSGYFSRDRMWGATATGLPILGGLIRISELRAGVIPHALAIEIPEVRANQYAWPAQRTDGRSLDPNAIPEGTRFRIDPSLNLSRLDLPPFVRTLARAAQKYGFYVTDGAGAVTFQAEDPAPLGSNPYVGARGFYGGQYPDRLLEHFPWERLQVVDAPLLCCGS